MERGQEGVAALSKSLQQGFSASCHQGSSYANGDRIWGWVRRLISACTLLELLADIPASPGTYLVIHCAFYHFAALLSSNVYFNKNILLFKLIVLHLALLLQKPCACETFFLHSSHAALCPALLYVVSGQFFTTTWSAGTFRSDYLTYLVEIFAAVSHNKGFVTCFLALVIFLS